MPCILLIDDNASVLQALEFFFKYEGYEVLLAPDGATGLRLAAEHPVDIVMLDIEMPRMSGMAVCSALKRNPALCQVPVLMMTGRPTRDLMAQALAAGANRVLGKPFDLDHLGAIIAELLAPVSAAVSPAVPEVEYGEAESQEFDRDNRDP